VQGDAPSRIKTHFAPPAVAKGSDRVFEEAERNLIPYRGTADDRAESCRLIK
jgi:hypothetical protein